ncbi:uncharacterized protein A4U43_C04F8690 [Asparagus officinalis]|uniref:Uncharacterized protein n=1 Tax=Asparagus officinalis TaxID=4686 RepID=A0A5P1F4R4_ASPOF|nr:uncharacterized protein A4U43_C04F8690 [Asparagus officinalis]
MSIYVQITCASYPISDMFRDAPITGSFDSSIRGQYNNNNNTFIDGPTSPGSPIIVNEPWVAFSLSRSQYEEKELNRPPTDAEVFIETRKKKKKAQPEKTLDMSGTLEQLTQELTQEQTEGENIDAWHLVNKKEHPGRVRLRGRAIIIVI